MLELENIISDSANTDQLPKINFKSVFIDFSHFYGGILEKQMNLEHAKDLATRRQ